jgi:hypothetical protein
MRPILIILLLLKLGLISGQSFSYPIIKNEGQTISNFIPIGWTILDSVSGDLNNNKTLDFAIILQHKDSVTLEKKGAGYIDTVTTQPRILIILFRNTLSNNYQLIEQTNSFILNHDDSRMEDPYQEIKIENGILQINFHWFYNTGGWGVSNSSYKFRYQNKNFVLIGADNNYIDRSTQDFMNNSYNFLTNKWRLTTGNETSKTKPESELYHLDLKELKTFKTFERPCTWQVTSGVYL